MNILETRMQRLADVMEYGEDIANWDAGTLIACATVHIKRLNERIAELENEWLPIRTAPIGIEINVKTPEYFGVAGYSSITLTSPEHRVAVARDGEYVSWRRML